MVRGIFPWRTLEARESIAIWGSAKAFVFFAAAYHEGKNEKSNGGFFLHCFYDEPPPLPLQSDFRVNRPTINDGK